MKCNYTNVYFNAIFPHYREEQWDLILSDKILDIKIYCSNKKLFGIESAFDYYSLKYPNKLKKLKNYIIFKRIIFWQSKTILTSLFGNYQNYIFLGEMNVISTWISAVILRIRNKRVYFWTHGLYGNESKIKYFLRIIFYKICNEIIVYENHSKKLLQKNIFLKNKEIHIIYNSLNFTLQNELYLKLRESNNSLMFDTFKNNLKTILFVGRLNDNKKINLAIEAIKKINSSIERLNFLIIGNGPELENINCQIANYRTIKRINGIYDEKILAEFIFHSDLMISPGNVGLNAIHSLTYGTPVCTHGDIIFQMPEFEALNRSNSIFFTKDDLCSLVQKLEEWLCNSEPFADKDLIRKVIIEKYNPKNQIRILNQILNKNTYGKTNGRISLNEN